MATPNWRRSRTPAAPTPAGGFSTGAGTRYADEEHDPLDGARMAGFGDFENPMDAVSAEGGRVREILESKAAGVGLEADRVTEQNQRSYSQGLQSALASRQGSYDPNVARQVERQRSGAALHGERSGRLSAQAEQAQAAGRLTDFETKMDAVNTAYQGALAAYESQVNSFNVQFNNLYNVAYAQSKNHELAKESAMRELANTQQLRTLAQMKADRDAAAADLQNQMDIFTGIMSGSSNLATTFAGKAV